MDSGAALRASRMAEHPLRIKLVDARRAEPKVESPTAGCTAPACITAEQTLLNALSTAGFEAGEMGNSVSRAKAKIAAWRSL